MFNSFKIGNGISHLLIISFKLHSNGNWKATEMHETSNLSKMLK